MSRLLAFALYFPTYLWNLIGTPVNIVYICEYICFFIIEIMHSFVFHVYAANWTHSSKKWHRYILDFAQYSSSFYHTKPTALNAICIYCDEVYITRGQTTIYNLFIFNYLHMSYTFLTRGYSMCHCDIKLPYYNDIYKCKSKHTVAVSEMGSIHSSHN